MIAGFGRADITPTKPMFMAGFDRRKDPSTGILDPLYVSVLLLKDEQDQPFVFCSFDVLGVDSQLCEQVRTRIAKVIKMDAKRIWVSSTHTHSAPSHIFSTAASYDPAFVATLLFMRDLGIWGVIVPTLLYILTAFTDMLDGQIARRCNLVTQFGKFIDPLADKFMVIGSQIAILVYMILRGEEMLALIFVWVVLVILFRELAVTGLRLAVGGKVDVAASIFGKLKTVSQMVGTVVMLVEPLIPVAIFSEQHVLSYTFMGIMTVTTLYSAFEYLKAYLPHIDFTK